MRPLRLPYVGLVVIFGMAAVPLAVAERPVVKSTEAASMVGKAATVYGRVIEVRRVANGPIIFELDGQPTAPACRALVYPMAAPRFGSAPEDRYLGQTVEVEGVVMMRKDLPQIWISDPSHIRLRPSAEPKPASPAE